ncbi:MULTISPECIES: beta-N-acetylhexosaminidase [unclassified Rhizobacter]|uniref:beta-N-acetylhexosaminidase n=1 Tax=unclassified Rhizobacter TaxID=2640088 RepID=UPI0006FE7689|nr:MULTISPECIES: beta-N-acetylhexosaminidase [unclassified Rhizobacter]KQU74884.1 beta-hexosaminidase [Rhizobacter sp. Root29]KQW01041.1 beta-hexosaminidase [Rhizobacter sp. Root1238]KRB03891.1 beta-hexosaminidase [Rhizobacter sp. Root16D2]
MSEHAPVILDIAGTALTDDDRRRLRHPLTGGMILFTRNWIDRRHLTELTAEVKSIRPDVLITVDHEGGRVQRFRTDGFTHLPAMREFGELWMRDAMRAVDAATSAGYVLGAELRACGVELSYTPVVDLDHGRSQVVGDRAFHRDPRVVAILAQALSMGLLRAGMANCGKHFPAHGYAVADSHVARAVDDRALQQILDEDAKPYDWLSTALTCVMPAHVTFPQVDAVPAGFSSRWLKEILRGQLGYTGAICCDDLSMEGARVAGTAVEAGIAALNAGCDLVLLCNQSKVDGGRPVDMLLDGLAQALAQGRWQADANSETRRLELLPQSSPLPWDELMHQPSYQNALERLP